MGYSTDFEGSFEFNRKLTEQEIGYLHLFSHIRHMKRDNSKIKDKYPNWKNRCLNGNLGLEGEFFIGDFKHYGQLDDGTILEYDKPPISQPGLWCKWIVSDDGWHLKWDGGEKFYNYIEWLDYMIVNFFKPMNLTLNGSVRWQGERYDDSGMILVVTNKIEVNYLDLT